MGKYVLVFKGGSVPQDEEEQKRVMDAWGAWFGSIGDGMVDTGNPFGASSAIAGDGSVNSPAESALTGYTIVNADSLDDAVKKSKSCPILEGGGGSIEVYETLDMSP
jgi:hypothetical protein